MRTRSDFIVVGAQGYLGGEIYRGLQAKGVNVRGTDLKSSQFPSEGIKSCDFASPTAVREYLDECCRDLSGDQLVLVLAQGKIHSEPVVRVDNGLFLSHGENSWDEVLRSNLKATFVGATEFARVCCSQRRRGLIVAFSSINAPGAAGQAAYSAAKAGIEALVRATARELGPMGIRAVSIAPGYIDAPSTRSNLSRIRLESVVRQTPLRRLGTAQEIISTVEWIADTEFVNGTTIEVSGGFTI